MYSTPNFTKYFMPGKSNLDKDQPELKKRKKRLNAEGNYSWFQKKFIVLRLAQNHSLPAAVLSTNKENCAYIWQKIE